MLERFGDEARRSVELAIEEARRLGHGHVGTEHLLLGLLAERRTAAARALTAGGATLALAREKVVEALASRSRDRPPSSSDQLPFTDRATRTLERASRLSARLGREDVRTEDVLLSLLDVEGTAGQVLRGMSVDIATVRRALELSDPIPAVEPEPEPQEPPPVSENGPICGICGAGLETSLARREMRNAAVTVVYCRVCGTAIGVV